MKEEIMNQTNIKIGQLRDRMKELGIDAYLVPTADFHESEYVGEFFKCRHFLTGFNGTAGTAVITMDKAVLSGTEAVRRDCDCRHRVSGVYKI